MTQAKPEALLVMSKDSFDTQFTAPELERLHSLASVPDPIVVTDLADATAARLASTNVLVTSWGCPPLTEDTLAALPNLRAVIHAAGSVRALLPIDVFQRGIRVSSAADMNAVPVAEFTLAAIILAGKRALTAAQCGRREPTGWADSFAETDRSNLGRTIGIVGFSKIGRRVVELLKVLQTGPVLVADPFAPPREILAAGAEHVSLDEALVRSEILSVHAPLLPSTRHLLGARELALLPGGATIINTARGAIIDHDALLAECATGRLDAILDVTEPEPLPQDHPLLALPNVTVTPHLAGSLGTETRRLTWHALDALEAFAQGRPMPGAVAAEDHEVSA